MRPSASRPLLLLALTLPLLAQGAGSFEFHHFHRYPTAGQWRTETTVTGIPVSQPATPVVQTACASPISLARRDAILKMDNDVAPASCKGTVLRDEERTAVAEQVCTGAPVQTIRTTLHAVDDTTLTTEVRSSTPGRPDTVVHSTSHFLGACNAGQQAEAAANAPLPSLAPGPEACAELPSMRQQAQDGLKVCESADFPQDERVTCRSTMSAVLSGSKNSKQAAENKHRLSEPAQQPQAPSPGHPSTPTHAQPSTPPSVGAGAPAPPHPVPFKLAWSRNPP